MELVPTRERLDAGSRSPPRFFFQLRLQVVLYFLPGLLSSIAVNTLTTEPCFQPPPPRFLRVSLRVHPLPVPPSLVVLLLCDQVQHKSSQLCLDVTSFLKFPWVPPSLGEFLRLLFVHLLCGFYLWLLFEKRRDWGVMAHTYNVSTQEAEEGVLLARVSSRPAWRTQPPQLHTVRASLCPLLLIQRLLGWAEDYIYISSFTPNPS